MDQKSPQLNLSQILESQFHSMTWLALRTRISLEKLHGFVSGKSVATEIETKKIAETLNITEDQMTYN